MASRGMNRISCRAKSRRLGLIIPLTALALGCDTKDGGRDPVGPALSEGPSLVQAAQFSDWTPAVRLESAGAPANHAFNTESLDGCPFPSSDGKLFFMASNRPGGLGGIDIWVSLRANEAAPWGAPVNLGAPVNSAFNDFCPTLDRDGERFFFVSNRPTWGPASAPSCGGADMYVSRLRHNAPFDAPKNLGCAPGGPNSVGEEASPAPLLETGGGSVLFFSSTRAGGFSAEPHGAITGDQDVYISRLTGGEYGPGELVPGINTASEEGQPNVSHDGRQIFFFSDRHGTLGLTDIYSATRVQTSAPWSTPVNLGPNVNSSAGETRPSLTWHGTALYFGSTRAGGEGSTDIYVTTRQSLSVSGH